MQFTKATKVAAKLRLALQGPPGSGKTYTALAIALELGRTALLDTEHRSSEKYADIFAFDVLEPPNHNPQQYIDAIHAAEQAGYDVLVIDSLSHAWMGREGALELVDRAAARDSRGNSFSAWKSVTPLQNALIEAIIGAKIHIIATLRTKIEYSQEKDDRGKTVIRKLGTAPVQRENVEYEFDVIGELDQENTLVISKTRCPALQGQVIRKPGKSLAQTLTAWLGTGPAPLAPQPQATTPSEPVQSIQDRVKAFEAQLVTKGRCKASELFNDLMGALGGKLGPDMRAWPLTAAKDVEAFCKEFSAGRGPVTVPQAAQLSTIITQKGETWPRVLKKLRLPATLQPADLNQLQFHTAMHALVELPDGVPA